MNAKAIIIAMSALLSIPLPTTATHVCAQDTTPTTTIQKGRHHGHKKHYRNDRNKYIVIDNEVFYRGRKLEDASAHSFSDLGHGYAKDAFNVYYKGKEIDDATAGTFTILKDGYAKDAFNAYYKGRRIEGASGASFKVMSDGYAKDSFNTYYKGRETNF